MSFKSLQNKKIKESENINDSEVIGLFIAPKNTNHFTYFLQSFSNNRNIHQPEMGLLDDSYIQTLTNFDEIDLQLYVLTTEDQQLWSNGDFTKHSLATYKANQRKK